MVEGSMTQGAGQGPDVWNGGTAADGAGARAGEPASRPPLRSVPDAAGMGPGASGPPHASGASDPEPGPEPEPGQVPGAAPGTEGTMPQEYTPTARDLPVIRGGAEGVPEPTMVDVPAATAGNDGEGPLYVVGDVHGYLNELRAALRQFGIIDAEDHWIAENARLWFLGDFTDRGPDGVGVIDLVMQLSAEAAAAGGYCKALLGNHELLLLGAKRFGDTPINSGAGTASFQAAWLLNGGQRTDMERLRDHHLQWMSRLDAIALADHHLMVHSDASCYLDYGRTIEDVNDALTEAIQRNDAEETWDLFRKFTKRFAFRDEEAGPPAVRELLDTFGGKRIVHGHSPIPYLLGQVGSEDSADSDGEESAPKVTGPHVYADGLAVAMDGGVTMAGKLLIAQLPLVQ
ncbi:metallophosphoesterase [Streptomyces iconiensis]|uniref:Metallophosphoesterase n=1 Tax=Streptomyces iconiensis TaxID=1384038 RepID=A0ABT6ZRM3_9ACTN|nr:metallophosphoesterase [Streptomyces iconiensis]MDJ1131722.1 metallophosphoesterase [Streptomyces iconiensis]